MTGRRVALVLAGIVAAVLAGCDDGGYSTAPAFNSPLDGTAQSIALGAYATRSAVEVGAVEAQAQATAGAAIYAATVQAQEARAEAQRQAATIQAAEVAAQAEAQRQTQAIEATRLAEAIRATQEARRWEATATADVQRWEATREAGEATAQAQATVGAMAARATATSQAWAAKTTATAESRQATQIAYQATATRQAQQREEVLAYGRDYGIPAVLLIVAVGLGALVIYGIRQQASRPVAYPRDFRGDAEPVAVPVKGGGFTFVDLDRQPGPAITVLPSGEVNAPQLRKAGQEERTTARDQLTDLATRPRLGGAKAGSMPALPVAPPPTPPAPGLRSVRMFRRLDQAGRVGAIPGPLLASLAADWETEPGEGL